ncbi:adenylate/guanylate cyclase domain-containing protein [Phragmitibacter flavus]|uniref:Adenylate/guanylate cyclase domain-containing protein n=1 Tax=Phragmitibacter flavus TaxID=2576071 RepID=A0A5R8K9Q1_9BACT|nr:adenylate/guanylate cyclase domain-containing protein [Phragmitibacter flavus]TLD68645.1 adenylate/guanylate cyclase domain-containing protein [Phragmitibacter flavus]
MARKSLANGTGLSDSVSQTVVLPVIFGVGLLLALGYGWFGDRGWLAWMDRQFLDEFHRRGVKAVEREDVVILGIDDASFKLDGLWPEEIEESVALKAMQRPWPWSRVVWAELLERMFAAGVKVVFLDVTFKGPSLDPAEDERLREVLQKHAGKVVLGMNFEGSSASLSAGSRIRLTGPPESIWESGEGRWDGPVHLNFWAEGEVVRKVSLLATLEEAELKDYLGAVGDYGGMSVEEAEKVGDELEVEMARVNPQDGIPSVAMWVANKVGAGGAELELREPRFRFADAGAYPPVSIHEVFVESLWESNFGSGEAFRDKVVFVGATASVMQDFHSTPVGRMAGVQLHAHALAAVMDRNFLKEAPRWWPLAGVGMGMLLSWALVTLIRQPVVCLLVLWGVSVALLVGAWWAFDGLSMEVSPLPGGLALNLCGLAGLSGNYLTQMREKKKLRRFLERYTSPEFVKEMMSDREGLYTMLGGAERTVTVLFSDVRGFTSMAEEMSPADMVKQLNEYLSSMVEQVIRHRGLVDKFIGDAVMALWGSTRLLQAEGGRREDARQSVESALAMRAALTRLNEQWRKRGIAEFKIGMGIHQGNVVVGNIGSAAPYEKMDLTVIGDSVNLASRLEGVTKEYGVDLVISGTVWELVKDEYLCRSADLVRVKGKVLPVEVFTVIGPMVTARPPGLKDYEKGIVSYREGKFVEALEWFGKAREAGLDDVLTSTYISRCEALMASPPEKWDGVFVMTKK